MNGIGTFHFMLYPKLNIKEFNVLQKEYLDTRSLYSILLAPTGSGKTVAYLQKILQQKQADEAVIVVVPTRELAKQVHQVFQNMQSGLSSIVCYGGHDFQLEVKQFRAKPQVVIGTPGRLLDHFNRQTEGLRHFSHLAFDEYDKILELGFLDEITQIYETLGHLKSIQLVSATAIEQLPDFLKDIAFERSSYLKDKQPQFDYFELRAEENDKLKTLALLLNQSGGKRSIVFCNHREACERISEHLSGYGEDVAVFHGGLEQYERLNTLFVFRNACVNTIVSSDLAARGIDIDQIDQIIHYQLPHSHEEFIHRNGRTSRIDHKGAVFVLLGEEEQGRAYLEAIAFSPFKLNDTFRDFDKKSTICLFINAGRIDKISKTDLVGYFTQKLMIPSQQITGIEIFDRHALIALKSDAEKQLKAHFGGKHKIKKTSCRIRKFRL